MRNNIFCRAFASLVQHALHTDQRSQLVYKFLVVTVVTVSGTFSTSAIGRAANPSATNSIGMKLVLIPAGEFVMGSPEGEGVPKFNQDEKQVRVKLTKLFYLGKHEVTQGQWQAVMKTRPWQGDSSVKEDRDFAATYVSWGDAMSFCRKLTLHERSSGKLDRDWEYTLPTEAQWEYACRAGSTKRYSFGDDESQLGEHAWYDNNANSIGEQYAHKVGRKKANAFALHDLHENVYKWCRD